MKIIDDGFFLLAWHLKGECKDTRVRFRTHSSGNNFFLITLFRISVLLSIQYRKLSL